MTVGLPFLNTALIIRLLGRKGKTLPGRPKIFPKDGTGLPQKAEIPKGVGGAAALPAIPEEKAPAGAAGHHPVPAEHTALVVVLLYHRLHVTAGNQIKIPLPVPLPPAVGLLFAGDAGTGAAIDGTEAVAKPVSLVMLIVPVVIIVLCLLRKHLITALSYGILAGIAAGLVFGIYQVSDLVAFPGGFSVEGLIISSITGTAGTVAMLIAVFSLLGVLECSGLFEDVGALLSRFAKKERSAEATIVLSTGILSMVTGVISVAIVALGDLVNDIGEKAGVDRYRRANLLDCTGCVFCFLAPWTVHCVIPAQQSAQFGEGFAVSPGAVPFVNYYSICMLVMLLIAIVTGYGRKRQEEAGKR